ncbi:MAG: hypothetical protein H6Q15_1415 [Bacteroidetes bacterium]|nr:hypothetical protein [Bacteroidota bacterium]
MKSNRGVLLLSAFFITLSLLSCIELRAQYRISIEIKNNNDSMIIIGNYYLKGTYALDTAYLKKGKFVFEKKNKTFDPGIYFFANSKGKYCEFMIDKQQKFSFITDEKDWASNMKVIDSKTNELYFKYMEDNAQFTNKANAIQGKKAELGDQEYNKRMKEIRLQSDTLKENFIKNNPDHLLSKVLQATKDIILPTPKNVYNIDGSLDSNSMKLETYNYYLSHYFDNMDLKCDGLLRTPASVFYTYYNNYWDEAMKFQTRDSIFSYACYWIEKSRGSKLMFKFLVHDITERYLKSKVLGYDEVYIKMIKKYYASGDATWMSPTDLDREVARANKWENLMIGKTLPDLYCPDTNNVIHNIYGLNTKYKLLIFWSYDCGHCATELPKFFEFYKKYKDVYNLEVMAFNSGNDLNEWKSSFIKKGLTWLNVNGLVSNYDWHDYLDIETTPFVLLLDKDNKIIAKKINGDNIENFIKYYDEGKLKF